MSSESATVAPAQSAATSQQAARPASTAAAAPAASSTPASSTPAASTPADSAEPPTESDPDESPAASGDISFEDDIWPIFTAQCGPCHVSLGLGGQNIGSADLEVARADAERFEDAVIDEIAGGTMPPACGGAAPGSSGCTSEEELQLIEDWYDQIAN